MCVCVRVDIAGENPRVVPHFRQDERFIFLPLLKKMVSRVEGVGFRVQDVKSMSPVNTPVSYPISVRRRASSPCPSCSVLGFELLISGFS